jgi:hypothetical protein
MAPPNLPATAQMLPESKRRFSEEPVPSSSLNAM